MGKNEFRAVIKHSCTSAPVFVIVYNRVNEYKRGRTSTKHEHRSERPVEVTTPEMIDKMHDMVLSDTQIKVREIVEATGISEVLRTIGKEILLS